MTSTTSVHEALLELGLEDLIPLPEILDTPEVRRVTTSDQAVQAVSRALVDLLRTGRIQVWSGHWDDDPMPVDVGVAEALVLDARRYSFSAEESGLERVYIVNVENLRAPEQPAAR